MRGIQLSITTTREDGSVNQEIVVGASDDRKGVEMIAPLPVGATGTVRHVRNAGTVDEQWHVDWDEPHERRSLMLLPGADRWEVMSDESR